MSEKMCVIYVLNQPKATTECWLFHIIRPDKLCWRSVVICVPLATVSTLIPTWDQVPLYADDGLSFGQIFNFHLALVHANLLLEDIRIL